MVLSACAASDLGPVCLTLLRHTGDYQVPAVDVTKFVMKAGLLVSRWSKVPATGTSERCHGRVLENC